MNSRYIRQFKKGALEMVLLHLISEGETYGYEILSKLNNNGGRILGHAREGTVYPILYRLEDSGLISCRTAPSPSNGGSRKFYSITPSGKLLLEELTDFWDEYKNCIDNILARHLEGDTGK